MEKRKRNKERFYRKQNRTKKIFRTKKEGETGRRGSRIKKHQEGC